MYPAWRSWVSVWPEPRAPPSMRPTRKAASMAILSGSMTKSMPSRNGSWFPFSSCSQ